MNRIDEAVLALLYLTVHDSDRLSGTARAWKAFDWDVMNRLHGKDLIGRLAHRQGELARDTADDIDQPHRGG